MAEPPQNTPLSDSGRNEEQHRTGNQQTGSASGSSEFNEDVELLKIVENQKGVFHMEYVIEEILSTLDRQLMDMREESSTLSGEEEWESKKCSTVEVMSKHIDLVDPRNLDAMWTSCLILCKMAFELLKLYVSKGKVKVEGKKLEFTSKKDQITKIKELVMKHLAGKGKGREDVLLFGEFILRLSG